MEIVPGVILNNRYHVERRLGQGGMGAVYLAQDISLEHLVAVKVNQNPAPESTTQFLREARLLAALRHPNLPRVIDYFIVDQSQLLVMDYIPGDDLALRIEKEGPQSVELVLRWTERLGSAVSYLHHQQPPVVHRDIKPANIKITPDGDAILVDFGIAKATDAGQATATGAAGYTPGFAPPEQYGSGHTDPRSDQFSLAATLYMALTGKQPVDSVQRVLGRASLEPAASLNPLVPAHIDAALQRGLAVHPEERFDSVSDLVKAITGPSYQPTVLASRPAPADLPLPPVIEGTVPYTADQVPVPPPVAQAPKRKWNWWMVAIVVVVLIGGACLAIGGGGLGAFVLMRSQATAPVAQAVNTPVAVVIADQPTPQIAPTQVPPTMAPAVAPSETPMPPTPTLEPSATSTQTLAPTEALAPLGGGGWVAFSSNRADGKTYQIWLMHLVLTDQGKPQATDFKQLTDGPGDKTQPAWSPDGKQLVFVAPADPAAGSDLGLDLWKINLDGTGVVDLTLRKGDDTDPAWSPDGNWIAFTSHGRADKIPQLYIVNPTGNETRRLSIDFAESQPAWTPDMSWLVHVISASSHNYLFLYEKPDQFPPPTPVPTPHTFDRTTIFGRLGEVANPNISLNGEYLAYTRVQGNRTQVSILKMATRGAEISVLTSTGSDKQPFWSRDTNWLTFTSGRDGNLEIYVMTTGGTQQTNLTQNPAADQQPAWQPVVVP